LKGGIPTTTGTTEAQRLAYPSPVPERKKRKGQITVSIGSAPLSPPMIKAGSPFEGHD
jgi:hypothetical protein